MLSNIIGDLLQNWRGEKDYVGVETAEVLIAALLILSGIAALSLYLALR